MKVAGKNFDDTWLQSKSADICALAHAKVNESPPSSKRSTPSLKEWYKSL
jgi:hypothetical protein